MVSPSNPSVLFNSFENCPGGDLIRSFQFGLGKACAASLIEFPVALTHVFGPGATCISRQSDSEDEAYCVTFSSMGRAGVRTALPRSGRKGLGRS